MAIAIVVEFSPGSLHAPWLDAFRLTTAGALLLGRIFSLWNLVAYLIGIVAGIWLDTPRRQDSPHATGRRSIRNRPARLPNDQLRPHGETTAAFDLVAPHPLQQHGRGVARPMAARDPTSIAVMDGACNSARSESLPATTEIPPPTAMPIVRSASCRQPPSDVHRCDESAVGAILKAHERGQSPGRRLRSRARCPATASDPARLAAAEYASRNPSRRLRDGNALSIADRASRSAGARGRADGSSQGARPGDDRP